MKIPIKINKLIEDGFTVKEGFIAGEPCLLVTPAISTNPDLWNNDNLIFRSSIWTKYGGELVSASFPKFFNLNEGINIIPDPTDSDLKNSNIISKIDGSTLIVSKYNGHLIHRTRGTFNAENLPNGNEIKLLKGKYPLAFDNFLLDKGISLLFEWTTPSNRIIIDYGPEPDLKLIGAITHSDYSLYTQEQLDYISSEIIKVPRPKIYSYHNLDELINSVQEFTNEEGVVVYFDEDKKLKKIKGLEYLKLHRFKSNATLKNVTEMFFDENFKSIEEYREYINLNFDYECFMMVEPYIKIVFDYYLNITSKIKILEKYVNGLKGLSRKDSALDILSKHKDDGLSGFCFMLLDGKEITTEKIKKFILNEMQENNE